MVWMDFVFYHWICIRRFGFYLSKISEFLCDFFWNNYD